MAEVKFILIKHTPDYLWNDNPASEGYDSGYNKIRQDALRDYPQALIFGQYVKSAGGKVYYELWANGQEYKLGGGSGAVYVGTAEVDENGAITPESWNALSEGATPEQGDVYVYSPAGAEGAQDRTAYYYDAILSKWIAFTGNVNAENVFFPAGFGRTKAWGTASAKTTPTSDSGIIGKNLKEVFEYYLLQELNPAAAGDNPDKGYHSSTLETWGISLSHSWDNDIVVKNASTDESGTSSDQLVKVGTTYYVPGRSFTPSLACDKANTSKTQTLGPAYIAGIDYGYWDNSSDIGKKDKLKSALNTANHQGHVHGDTHDFTISYNENLTNGSNTLTLNITKFTDESGSSASSTANGSSELSVAGRTLTTTEGVNKVSYSLSVGNKWERSVSGADNSMDIPAISTIYLATNKSNPIITSEEGVTPVTYKSISQTKKTISDSESQKTISDKSTGEWKVTAVNPIVTNGIVFASETKTNDSGAYYNSNKTSTLEILRDYINNSSGYWYFGFGQLNTATETGKNWTFTVPSGITVTSINGNNESAAISWDLNFKTNSDSTLNFNKSGDTYTRICTAGASVIRVGWSKQS